MTVHLPDLDSSALLVSSKLHEVKKDEDQFILFEVKITFIGLFPSTSCFSILVKFVWKRQKKDEQMQLLKVVSKQGVFLHAIFTQ